MELIENHLDPRNNFYNQPDNQKDNQASTRHKKILINKNFKHKYREMSIGMQAFPIKN